VEKEIYQKRQFYTYEKTNYSCPQCHVGRLKIDKKSIKAIEYRNYNKKIQSTDEFEVEWLKFGFYGHLICDNKECREKIVFAGKLTPEYGEYENPFVGEDNTIIHNGQKITIEYIERSPQIIKLKRAYPKEISQQPPPKAVA
jgi:hypothetical protein